MSFDPIDLGIDAGPLMNSTFADFTVSAKSRIVDGSRLLAGAVGTGGPPGLGAQTAVHSVVHDPSVPVTYLDESSGVLHVASGGITVLPDGSADPPSISDYTLYVVAHSNAVTVEQAQDQVRDAVYDPGVADVLGVAGGAATATADMRAGGLTPGVGYTFSVHGYDASEGHITTILASGTTTQDPVFDLVAADRGVTRASLSFQVTDPDSAVTLRAAVVPLSAVPADVQGELVDGSYAGEFYEEVLPPGTRTASSAHSNLAPATAYRVVAVAVDSTTSNVTADSTRLFTTYAAPTVSLAQTGRTYTGVTAESTHSFQMDGVDVATAVVPNTPADIAAFLASGADPLGNLAAVGYPTFGTYTSTVEAPGLTQGVQYAAVSKAVPAVQPDEYGYDVLVVATAQAPVITIGATTVNFFDAIAPFRVVDPDDTVNVYAAIHPADTDPPYIAQSNLLALGSAAYPNAVVAVDTASFSNDVARYDLLPETQYHITVVAVETEDGALVTSRSASFFTMPVPRITLSLGSFTDTVLTADVTSTGETHDLFVHVTPYVVGSSVVYDPDAIAATPASDGATFIVPAGRSNDISPAFTGLLEHTRYGIVVVAAQEGTHAVLSQEAIVAKTAALPDLEVAVDAVSYRSVAFSVIGADMDGPFRVLTAVSSDAFAQGDAEALAAAGLAYAGSGVVPGTLTDFPNDVDATSVNFDYSHSNLAGDTDYVAVAVAVDEGSGVVQWAQQPFLTDFRPTAVVTASAVTSFTASFDLLVADRDGPSLTVRYAAYDSPTGLDETVVAADPLARAVASPGTGPRTLSLRLTGLEEGRTYHLGAVAISPDGTASLAAVHEFTTDSRPIVSFTLDEVLARELKATIDVQPNSAPRYDASVALFPYGTAVDDALVAAALDGSASNMIARVLFPDRTAAASEPAAFEGLTPGDRLAVVGAAVRDDGDDDVVYAVSNLYLRVEPHVGLAAAPAVTTTTVDADVSLAYSDPDAARHNSADLVASVVPSGHADYSWLVAGAASNPAVPAAAVQTHAGVDAVAAAYAASNLEPATAYDLVLSAADAGLAQTFLSVTPFTTRARVALTASVASVTASSAAVDLTAALPDGTFDLFVDVFQDAASAGTPVDGWYDAAAASGHAVGSNASFLAERHTFSSLASQRDYVAVAVAVDDLSGEQFRAFAAFTTSALPPSVSVVSGSAAATSGGATLQLLVRDLDSRVTVRARAFELADADPVDAAVVAQVAAAPDYERAFHPSIADTPFSVTVTGLLPDTRYRLVAVAQDAVTGSNVHDFEDFDTLRAEDFLDRVEYDNAYTLTWRRTATYSAPVRGVQVANGKIAFRTRLDDVMGVTDVSLGGSFDFNSYGGYTNNVVSGFDTSTLSLFDHSLGASPASFTLSNQTLDMQTGVVRNEGRLVHAPTSSLLDVEQDVLALRQMPFCTLNMYRLTPGSDVPEMRVFHEMAAGAGMDGARYDSVTVYHPSTGTSVPVFQGEAGLRGSSHTVACATVYLFDGASLSNAQHSGFNTFRNLERAFDSHLYRDLAAGATYSWATLTAQASSADFPNPARELPRLLLQTLGSSGSDNPYDVAVRLRADHVSAWAKTWQTSATLSPKAGLATDDERDFYRVKRALRFAQFQLFATVRDHGEAELNPLHLSSIDADGNLFWNRELWVIPALIYLRPKTVRAMLEHRFDSLRAAKTLAAAQGHEGARFPYVGDAVSYGAAPYWDVASASYVFNSALVAVAAWDYFRATHDRDWLIAKGYPIVAAIADYLCSVAAVDGATGAAGFPDVLDVNGQRVTDPSFTVYIGRSALRGAIESTYELRYPLRDRWAAVYSGLSVKYHGPAAPEVVRHHSTASLSDELGILEPLMVLHPHYITDFLRRDLPRLVTNDHDTILRNAGHYDAAMSPAYRDNPFNTLMRMSLYAQVNRSTGAHSDTVKGLLLKAIGDAERDVWGAVSAQAASPHNDVSLSALLVLTFITSFAGMHVSGGVAQSGFYYVPFGVRAHATSHLPDSWQGVVVTSGDNRTFNVINSAVYDPESNSDTNTNTMDYVSPYVSPNELGFMEVAPELRITNALRIYGCTPPSLEELRAIADHYCRMMIDTKAAIRADPRLSDRYKMESAMALDHAIRINSELVAMYRDV
eukprot:jgi/Tetstr1/464151/TSEL_008956.t1